MKKAYEEYKRIEYLNRQTNQALNHTEYNRGYSDGFKEGYSKALHEYQSNLVAARNPTPILINCKENKECPYKKDKEE